MTTKKKRLDFACWKCQEEFSYLIAFEGNPKVTVYCPYCETECVADLDPYNKTGRSLYKSLGDEETAVFELLALPDIIPTSQPEADENN